MAVDKVSVLKIDKDCFVDRHWTQEYLRLITDVCRRHGVTVVSVKKCYSHHKGVHYYIEIDPPVEANLANMLQYLVGDDCQRVDHNRARIDAGSPSEWNKLFEAVGRRLTTTSRLDHNRVLACGSPQVELAGSIELLNVEL
jgi:hypothetical protein